MSEEERWNETGYCHDQEIADFAEKLGIKDGEIINEAFSIGECCDVYGGGAERAFEFLNSVAAKKKKGRGSKK